MRINNDPLNVTTYSVIVFAPQRKYAVDGIKTAHIVIK